MTILTATAALRADFDELLENLNPFTIVIDNTTSTGFKLTLEDGQYIEFGGSNLTYDFFSIPNGGSLTSAKVYSSTGVELYSLSGFSVTAGSDPSALLDDLSNLFDGADTVNGSAFGDTIFGFAGGDTLKGNGGADTIYGQAGSDTITGGAGNDTIRGSTGVDTISGGADHDKIYGGTGHDTLTGNLGADTFYFVDPIAKQTTTGGWDEIKDFNPLADTIALKQSVFNKLLAVEDGTVGPLKAGQFCTGTDNIADQKDDRVVYNKTTGELWYDSNGSDANTATSYYLKIAELDLGTGHPQGVSAADFVLV